MALGDAKLPGLILKGTNIVLLFITILVLLAGEGTFFTSDDFMNAQNFGVGTLMMCMIVTTLLLISHIIDGDEAHKNIFEPAFCAISSLFMFSASVVTYTYWVPLGRALFTGKYDCAVTVATFMLFMTLTYAGEAAMAFLNYKSS